jgi:hypothetical protein
MYKAVAIKQTPDSFSGITGDLPDFVKYNNPHLSLANSSLGILQLIEDSSSTEESLKAPLRGTFKLFSGFHVSAKRCNLCNLLKDREIIFNRDDIDN